MARLLLVGLLLILPAGQGLRGQDAPPLRLEVSSPSGETTGGAVPGGVPGGAPSDGASAAETPPGGVTVRLGDVLGDEDLQEALHSGLPLRVEIVTELWRDGFFDGLVGRHQRHLTVILDPLVEDYLVRVEEDGSDAAGEPERYATLPELREGFPAAFDPPLAPRESGRHYYTGRITVQTLSLSDLDELRRWLRGELAGAVSGEREVESALERGLRRTVVRLLGLPSREYETRTSSFEMP